MCIETTAVAAPGAFGLIRKEPDETVFVNERWFRLTFSMPQDLTIHPGQFLTLKPCSPGVSLLPRPFSVHRWNPSDRRLSLLIERRGPATNELARRAGGSFQLLVPLGKGFDTTGSGLHILLGGGIGTAPLFFLAETLQKRGEEVLVLAGYRSDRDACGAEDVVPPGVTFKCAVENGTGFRGNVIDLLNEQTRGFISGRPVHLYACGPVPMLKTLARFYSTVLRGLAASLQVSLEGMMGCGVGACQGCACDTTAGRRLLCTCGPVFPAEKVVWAQ